MPTIWERAATALSGLGLPGAAEVYIPATGAALPDQYLVWSLVASPPEQHADNVESLRSYLMQISIYSRAGLVGLPDIAGAMTAAGFTPGARRPIPYNADTRHFGLASDYVYLEEAT